MPNLCSKDEALITGHLCERFIREHCDLKDNIFIPNDNGFIILFTGCSLIYWVVINIPKNCKL